MPSSHTINTKNNTFNVFQKHQPLNILLPLISKGERGEKNKHLEILNHYWWNSSYATDNSILHWLYQRKLRTRAKVFQFKTGSL